MKKSCKNYHFFLPNQVIIKLLLVINLSMSSRKFYQKFCRFYYIMANMSKEFCMTKLFKFIWFLIMITNFPKLFNCKSIYIYTIYVRIYIKIISHQTSHPNAHSRPNYLWHKIQIIELFIKLISSLACRVLHIQSHRLTHVIADLFSDSMACEWSLYRNRCIELVETAKILVVLMKILVWSFMF